MSIHVKPIVPDSHGEWIDILIKCVEKEDCLNDHIVNPVDIKFNLGSAVTVAKTKLCLFQISLLSISNAEKKQIKIQVKMGKVDPTSKNNKRG